jgi:hypothetical protein
MWAVKFAHLEYNFFLSAIYHHKCPYRYKEIDKFEITIAQWSMPVRQFLRNLQMRGAFIAAFTSEK